MGFGGSGSGGSSSISGSSDAALSNPQQSDVLAYNATTSKWTNSSTPSGGGNGYVRYVYYTGSSWPARPGGIETVVWVGGTSSTPPVQATETFDMWIHDAEL